MKYLVVFLFIFPFIIVNSAFGLEKKSRTKELNTSSIGIGKQIQVLATIDLPDGQKLNPGAPSHITIFEKTSDQWEPIQKINLNHKVVLPGQDLRFTENVNLNKVNSEIAIEATVYHCSVSKGPCYIDEFQTFIKRSPTGSDQLSAKFIPTKKL